MSFTTFVNFRLCSRGKLISDQRLVVSNDTGFLLKSTGYIGGEIVDLEDTIVSPGFLELQTNGRWGFHFTTFDNEDHYKTQLARLAKKLVQNGVSGFYATIPTVPPNLYKKILPCLRPTFFPDSASLLGAHVEGPFLNPAKAGAHNSELFRCPSEHDLLSCYGQENLLSSVKLVTLAPELDGSEKVLATLSKDYEIRVALGHSSATYTQGFRALQKGATGLTHVFNAMSPLHHREPGLPGLISTTIPSPYYSLIADNIHLHPSVLNMAFQANPSKAILITDSLEVGGLDDGVHPGNAQVNRWQHKQGHKVVISGTDTLIGGCAGIHDCVINLMKASGCSVAEAVRCVTENIANFMGIQDRGFLEVGKRADFVVLNEKGELLQTWIAGRKVWTVSS